MTAGLDWDYSGLASAYGRRPAYAAAVLESCWRGGDIRRGMRAADVGAGTGHLTVPLLRRGLRVTAIEPNDDMRRAGIARTRAERRACWVTAVAEALPLAAGAFDLVTFGSSFNVVDQARALDESARVLKPGGWLVCVWNHRDLDDPLQARIEALIRDAIPDYRYGARRTDQGTILASSPAFPRVRALEARFVATMPSGDVVEAWRSHVTLRRQAGARLPRILEGIRELVATAAPRTIAVPYTTRVWMAQRSPACTWSRAPEPRGPAPGQRAGVSPQRAHAD